MQRNYYSSAKLMEVAKHRGYHNARTVAYSISQDTGLSMHSLENKISTGHFSREEMIVIASYFEMTPKEFCDVFLYGLFAENDLGHYIAHVDSPYAVLHPPKGKTQAERKEEKRQADLQAILEQIEQM